MATACSGLQDGSLLRLMVSSWQDSGPLLPLPAGTPLVSVLPATAGWAQAPAPHCLSYIECCPELWEPVGVQ